MKTYTQAELNEIIRNHKHWLQEDADGWERMRADLTRADLTGADLTRASLTGANLTGADLYGADLTGADLTGADLYVPMACPDAGEFVGWKKASGLIVKLKITEDADRSSATGRKCRCNKAEVLELQNLDGSKADVCSVSSSRDRNFVYTVGAVVEVPDFDKNRWNECAAGIHFFINRQEAVNYNG